MTDSAIPPTPMKDVVAFLGIAAVFPWDGEPSPDMEINSISFSDSGKYCVCSRTNGYIELVNTETGVLENRFLLEHGANQVKFTHHEMCVLVAGTTPAGKSIVYYVSMYDGKVMREYKSHMDKVTNISMCPSSDMFLTTSLDRTFMLWDLRSDVPLKKASATVSGCFAGAFDASGLVLGIAAPSGHVHLYDPAKDDATSFLSGHVASLEMEAQGVEWSDLQFSDDDRYIALASRHGIVLLNAFTLEEIAVLKRHPFDHYRHCNLSFSVDGAFLFTGGKDGFVHSYDLSVEPPAGTSRWEPTLEKVGAGLVATKVGAVPAGAPPDTGVKHNAPVTAVAVHPSVAMIASACTSLCLWTLPTTM